MDLLYYIGDVLPVPVICWKKGMMWINCVIYVDSIQFDSIEFVCGVVSIISGWKFYFFSSLHSFIPSLFQCWRTKKRGRWRNNFFWNGGQWAKRKEPIRIIPVWLYRFVSTSPHQIYRNGFESNTHSVLFILFVLFIAHKHKLLNIIIGNWMLN